MNRSVLLLCAHVLIWIGGFKKKNVTGSRSFHSVQPRRNDYYKYKWRLFAGFVSNPDFFLQ